MHLVNRLHFFLEGIIDICFPPSDEAKHVRSLTHTDIVPLLCPATVQGITALSSFSHPSMRALIHEAKYHNSKRAHIFLAHLLTQFLARNAQLTSSTWVPIPLSRTRVRARGYNQVEEILSNLSKKLLVRNDLLTRIRDTRPQTELDRSERLINMEGAFTVLDPTLVRNADIILIDDVVTTGATLRAAETALRIHSPRSITLLALAH